jgi:hypothetical protein
MHGTQNPASFTGYEGATPHSSINRRGRHVALRIPPGILFSPMTLLPPSNVRIRAERFEIHSRCELLNHRNRADDIAEPALR